MAEGAASLKGLRAHMAAAAQQAEEWRGQAGSPAGPSEDRSTTSAFAKTEASRPVIDGAALRVEDRLRVAKERREEQEKQQAARESQALERERAARMQQEKQAEERQRRLEEQRRKEEQRRVAVEEKRRQKQEEEKEHYEAVLRRTLERSQRLDQKQKRWSWGGGLTADSGDPDGAPSSPVAIVVSPCSPDKPEKTVMRPVDKNSTSTVNPKQQADPAISKSLTSPSAALMNAAGKNGRLLTPTQASLARSKSAATLSATGAEPQAGPLPLFRGPLRSLSSDRMKPSAARPDGAPEGLQKTEKEKRFISPGSKRPASPSSAPGHRRRSPSPASPQSGVPRRPPSPTAAKPGQRPRPPSPGALAKQRPPSPQPNARPPPAQRPALTPTGPPTLRRKGSKLKESAPAQPQDAGLASSQPSSKTKDDTSARATGGTTSAEEAARILAENRRLAREQKEREEQLKVEREKEERLRKEEKARLAAEERVRQAEEEQRRAEERKREEEEQAVIAEEERQRLELEEQERQAELQKEREEAEIRALEEAEKQRQERERIMRRNQQERLERKKRIEEIMKRTRKTDRHYFKRDDEKGMLDENEEEDSDAKEGEEKDAFETEEEGWGEPADGPMADREWCPSSVNGPAEVDNKDVPVQGQPMAVSSTPITHLAKDSEFVNQAIKTMPPPGLNGKVEPWGLDQLLDLGVLAKGRPLLGTEGQRPSLIDTAADPKGASTVFEDKGGAVAALCPSPPTEALTEM